MHVTKGMGCGLMTQKADNTPTSMSHIAVRTHTKPLCMTITLNPCKMPLCVSLGGIVNLICREVALTVSTLVMLGGTEGAIAAQQIKQLNA